MNRRQDDQEYIEVDTLDQKILVHIQNELAEHTRALRSINTAVQVIGVILILAVLAACFMVIFGPDVLF